MMEAQSITNGGPAISADWMLTIAITVIGFLLLAIAKISADHILSTLKKIDKKLEEHDQLHDQHLKNHNDLSRSMTRIETQMQSELGKMAQETADIILMKLKIAGSRPSDWGQ